MFQLTPFALSGILATITSLPLGIYVLVKSANKNIGRSWFLFSLTVGIWGICTTIVGLNHSTSQVLLAWKLSHTFSVVWIPLSFYNFILNFCDKKKSRIDLNFYITFFFFFTSPFFFTGIQKPFTNLYYPTHSVLYPIFVIWWIIYVLQSHHLLIKSYSVSNEIKRNQIKYFFLGMSVSFFGGITVYLPNFGIDIYPWGNFLVFFYPLIMSFAILKYNLMDVRVFVRRTVLILLIYTLLIILSTALLIFFHDKSIKINYLEILIISLIFSSGPFLYAYFVRQNSFFGENTIAGLAHELKSPIAIIENASEIIRSSKKAERKEEYLDLIDKNVIRLNRLIEDILISFGGGCSRDQIKKDFVNLYELIKNITSIYLPLVKEKGIVFNFTCPKGLIIKCDSLKMEQVISNLLSNAFKHTSNASVNLEVIQDKKLINITVQDGGNGITVEDLPFIFNRFYKGKCSIKGSGLGLYISKKWIEAHGGKIWVDSGGTNKGTTVSFTIPSF